MKDRQVNVSRVNYDNSPLLCNIILTCTEAKKGGLTIVGLTKGEAREVYKQLGKVI